MLLLNTFFILSFIFIIFGMFNSVKIRDEEVMIENIKGFFGSIIMSKMATFIILACIN